MNLGFGLIGVMSVNKLYLAIQDNQILLDRLLTILITSTFILFTSLTYLKFVVLLISLIYIVAFKKVHLEKSHVLLLILTMYVFAQSVFSLFPSLSLQHVMSNLVLNIMLFFLLTLIVKSQKSDVDFFVHVVLINMLLIFVFYFPLIFSSEALFRINRFSVSNLFYYSANFLSFVAVMGHVLWFLKLQNIAQKYPLKQPHLRKVVHFVGHALWFAMGYYTVTRSYYVLLFAVIGIALLYNLVINHIKDRRHLISVLSMGLLSVLMLILLLSNLEFIDWIRNFDLSQVNNLLINRFLSLLKLLFSDNQVLDMSTLNRLRLLQSAWSFMTDYPLFGVGLGTFRFIASTGLRYGFHVINSTHSHAEMFELFVSFGSFGYFIFMTFYALLLFRIRHHQLLFALLFTALITSFFFNVYYDKTLWWIFLSLIWLKGSMHETTD